jgi:hypothetical protein
MPPRLKVSCVSSVINRDGSRAAAWLAVACVVALMLAACGSDTVAKSEPPAQYIPPESVGPAEAAPEPEPEEPSRFDSYQAGLVPPPGEYPVTRAALLLPLTGRHAAIGQALLNAAQLALFDVADDHFALIVRDTQGTPEGASLAIQSALEERVNVVIGPLFAASAFAVAADTRSVGLNMLSFSNDRAVAGDGVFIAGMPPSEQVERIVDYSTRQGLLRFAILAPETTYGFTVTQTLRQALYQRGAELVRTVSYNPASGDITPEIRVLAQYDERHQALVEEREKLEAMEDEASQLALDRLENLDTLGKPDFDAVLLPIGGRSLLSIAASLAFFDVDPAEVKFLGTALWNDPSLGKEPTLQGGWFAAPSPELWESFQQRYRNTYDTTPPRIATLAYDMTALAAILARATSGPGQAPDFSVARLTDPSGFSGIDGLFRFSEAGTVERGLAILEVDGTALKEIEPAPLSFEGLVN